MNWRAEITEKEAGRLLGKRENEFKKDLRRDRDKTHGADGNHISDVYLNRLENHGKCLEKIYDAWERIRNGTYGICLDCEESIPEKELRITPERGLCVFCKKSKNKNRRSFV
ncbi:MAG: TraR/DksA C4-type zinc finger protein [Candidatus Portnoybacteria bacterium]|nr:TraR/DksA C4-type zinc finger protein [Candidatus Portnoybacteria bacterium]